MNAVSPLRAASATAEYLDAGWPEVVGVAPCGARGIELIRELAGSAFQSLVVPTEFGGGGGSLLDLAAAQRAIARLDPSAAIALNMHSLSVGMMVEHWRRHRDTSWFLLEALVEQRALVASAFAEPGVSANFLRAGMKATPTASGYVLRGRKLPCSLATSARLFCFTARVEGHDETIVGLCPNNAPGVSTHDVWDGVGMRGSDTGAVEFADVEIDDRLVFYRSPPTSLDEMTITGIAWFSVLMASTYHGVLTELCDAICGALVAGPDAPRHALASRTNAGRAIAAVAGLGAMVLHNAAGAGDAHTSARAVLAGACALRATASRAVDDVVTSARTVLGSRAYSGSRRAGALVLDALAVHHHPPSIAVVDHLLASALVDDEPSLDVEP
jgi:alkylation response protein AidB-like acyl-CoA dehydrogenase